MAGGFSSQPGLSKDDGHTQRPPSFPPHAGRPVRGCCWQCSNTPCCGSQAGALAGQNGLCFPQGQGGCHDRQRLEGKTVPALGCCRQKEALVACPSPPSMDSWLGSQNKVLLPSTQRLPSPIFASPESGVRWHCWAHPWSIVFRAKQEGKK